MFWSQRRLLSQCAQLLRTDKARAFFEGLARKADHHCSGEAIIASKTELSRLHDALAVAQQYNEKYDMLMELKTLFTDSNEEEIRKLASDDCIALEANIDDLADKLANLVIPITEFDLLSKCQLEITPGVGGVEASLFAAELANMYQNYAQRKKWTWLPFQYDKASSGGIRSAVVFVRGDQAYKSLRYEAGVHRVQRFPVTDRSRIHTSTAVVTVLPEPEKVEACINPGDVKVETMRASGPGGQNVNQRSTAVRLTHRETGIIVHCMDERTQYTNMEIAFERLAGILLQRKLDASQKEYSSCRKLQVGTKARAEKVRTYNFKDDQITDHRLGRAWKHVNDVLCGDGSLEEIIDALDRAAQIQSLNELFDTQTAAHRQTRSRVQTE